MHITHSIIDSSCIAVKTEAGTMIHTGDFKIDHTPIDGFPTDLHRLAHYGEEVFYFLHQIQQILMLLDLQEQKKQLDQLLIEFFKMQKGELLCLLSSSNIHRSCTSN